MESTYTGKIHRGPSTVTAIFLNESDETKFGCDEKDLVDDIDVNPQDRKTSERALQDLQNYKTRHGIELDYPMYFERT